MQYRFTPLAVSSLTVIGLSGCDHDDYYRHAYNQPPVIVVQAPAPAPPPPPAPTYVAPPPYPYYQPYPYYAPAPAYYGAPGYGYYYGRRGGD